MARPPGWASGAYALLATAVLCVSVGSIFIRFAAAPPLAVAFYRITLATLVIAPFASGSAVRAWPVLSSRRRLAVVASGIALGVHFATWIASLSFTSVAVSVLLVNTAPLFTLAFSRLVLREAVASAVMVAMAVALAGVTLIAAADWSGSASSLFGSGLAVAGALTLSAYHVIGRGLRDALPLPAYVLCVWAVAAATLAVLVAVSGVAVTGYSGRTYGWLLALALIPTVAGHGLVNRSLRSFPAPTVGLVLLGEPVAAAALAYTFLGERIGPATLAGGALVVAALAIVVRSEAT